MVPYDHAILRTIEFGGKPEDYLPIDEFLDSSKLHYCNEMHRLFLHNSFGIQLCEQVFGSVIINSDGITVPVRELARRHIMDDQCYVPTLKEAADAMKNPEDTPWVNRINKSKLAELKEYKQKHSK